jgi:AcrR family transcriptional regulator
MMDSGKRVYRSDLRADQARATRRQVVTAASRLFAERGYAATTIAAVAAEAGVSRKTVFTSVGGKVQLMKLAYDWAIAGDDEPLAQVERPEIRELQAEPDAAVVIEKYVGLLEESLTRVAPIHDALRSAADVDDQARELLETMEKQRLRGMGMFAADLDSRGVLRKGLTREGAADLLWFYIQPIHWDLLVQQRGWSRAAYRTWLRTSLELHLLGLS